MGSAGDPKRIADESFRAIQHLLWLKDRRSALVQKPGQKRQRVFPRCLFWFLRANVLVDGKLEL
jgi:hypothetical protein